MRGGEDPANRAPMPWDRARWDLPTLARFQSLIALRHRHRALRRGRFTDLSPFTGHGVLAFLRETDDPAETVLVAAHLDPAARAVNLYLPTGAIRDGIRFTDLLAPDAPDLPWAQDGYVEAGRVRVTLPPRGLRVLGADAGYIRDYRFHDKR